MKTLLDLTGKSQYSSDVNIKFQSSACGPTTAHVILNYISANTELANYDVNELYKILGATKIGLHKWQMIRNLQQLLGANWNVADCSISEALNELRNGRPVAMKFDKYFSFNWRAKPLYAYHWVPLIGYEILDEHLYLTIHDNGGPNRESQVRSFKYDENRNVLSFVKIAPKYF